MDSGVATRPIEDMETYRQHLQQFVYHSGNLVKPVFQQAKSVASARKRVVFAEGEEERVLRAVQIVVDEQLATPILAGASPISQCASQ
ncbi:hypothetical protein AEMCBJ_12695 [Cupriavidus necator]